MHRLMGKFGDAVRLSARQWSVSGEIQRKRRRRRVEAKGQLARARAGGYLPGQSIKMSRSNYTQVPVPFAHTPISHGAHPLSPVERRELPSVRLTLKDIRISLIPH
ncbi:unnamed protein product, partial [Iphiclides podalirius]